MNIWFPCKAYIFLFFVEKLNLFAVYFLINGLKGYLMIVKSDLCCLHLLQSGFPLCKYIFNI